ncbi:MAG: ribosome-associated translation inhibitor RaiA [Bifidobacteriaceae bacterium]|jgi:ribosomal subunit interface protein|nr:ribosome-associated translation inhibitor RaiA [Bifidobacteriaceae bacterium]
MEIQISGQNTKLDQKFKSIVEKKITKVSYYVPSASLIRVEVKEEKNPSRASEAEKVEITISGQGSVYRSTSPGIDRYAALDEALYKLYEQLRRAHDKLLSLRNKDALKFLPLEAPSNEALEAARANVSKDIIQEMSDKYNRYDEEPLAAGSIVRSKVHKTKPMTKSQAIYNMEMLGHPFFIFINKETNRPALVYARRNWNYGVLELEIAEPNQKTNN